MVTDWDVQLCEAARKGNLAGVQASVAAGADVNAFEGTREHTPLLCAADGGHVAVIEFLRHAGGHVDGADCFDITPLMRAACSGRSAAIEALIAAGADVSRQSNIGNTALHWAAEYGRLDAVRALLDAAVNIHARNEDGMTAAEAVSVSLQARATAAQTPACGWALVCASVRAGMHVVSRPLQSARHPLADRRACWVGPPPSRRRGLLLGRLG
jgi:hypothetical protein